MSSQEQDSRNELVDVDDVETNGNDALRPLHDLDSEASGRVVSWIIGGQSVEKAERPSIDEVVECLDKAPIALALSGQNGYAFVSASFAVDEGEYLHYKEITNDEQVAAVAKVENRDPEDVRFTRAIVDRLSLREWVHLSLTTGRLEIASLDSIDVFDDVSAFDGGRE